jgi:hypothetical protein
MDWKKLIPEIADLAEKVAPMVGGPAGEAAVIAAKAVLKLIDRTQQIAGATEPQLRASRDLLEKSVNDHLDRTIAKLEG